MKAAWLFLKKWGALIGGVLLALLTLGLVGGFAARKFWRDRLQAEDKARVADAEKKLEYLRGAREFIERRVDEEDETKKHLDAQIEEQREVIRETMSRGAGMSDEEVAAEFSRLGY